MSPIFGSCFGGGKSNGNGQEQKSNNQGNNKGGNNGGGGGINRSFMGGSKRQKDKDQKWKDDYVTPPSKSQR